MPPNRNSTIALRPRARTAARPYLVTVGLVALVASSKSRSARLKYPTRCGEQPCFPKRFIPCVPLSPARKEARALQSTSPHVSRRTSHRSIACRAECQSVRIIFEVPHANVVGDREMNGNAVFQKDSLLGVSKVSFSRILTLAFTLSRTPLV
jgi:hypothetical protein